MCVCVCVFSLAALELIAYSDFKKEGRPPEIQELSGSR